MPKEEADIKKKLYLKEKIKNAYVPSTADSALQIRGSNAFRHPVLQVMNEVLDNLKTNYDEYIEVFDVMDSIKSLRDQQHLTISKMEELQKKLKEKNNLDMINDLKTKLYNLHVDNLGLEIRPVKGENVEKDGGLSFIFNIIHDEKSICDLKPHQMSFFLRTDGVVYNVSNCNPKIKELDDLMLELNNSNDLKTFVLQMRRKFNALCT